MTCSSKYHRAPALGGRRRISAAASTLCAAVLAASSAAAQSVQGGNEMAGRATVGRVDPEAVARPSLRAFSLRASPASAPIVLDGRLDEAIWQSADSASDFVQALPRDGYPASERSVVRVLYDDETLYIGAMLYDSQPDDLRVPGLEQDFATHDSDLFGFAIDTYWDHQNAFLFAINPAGAFFDAQNFNDSRYTNRAWEGVVHVKTSVHRDGWTAEMAIPLTTLRFTPAEGDQSWGINFLRRVRRLNEDSYWAPLVRQHRVHKMSRAGVLTGLRGLRQGRNLTIKPYVSAGRTSGDLRGDELGNDVDVGLDVKYGVTSRLTLDVTALTDFSQVEVDQEQVNLTRFSLFFPEKREFFMENDGVFSLGDVAPRNYRTGSSPREFTLFHSRRIGLSEDRVPIPIAGGARLTGRAGDLEVGILSMQTLSQGDPLLEGFTPAENFTVARIRKDAFGGGSDIGAMFINRQGTSSGFTDSYNRSFGFDANVQMFGYGLINTYLARTERPGQSGNANAGSVQLAWRSPVWDVSGFVKHVGDAFDPGVGFVRRTAMRQAFATVGAHPQPDLPHVQEINPYVDVSFISDLDWNLETRELLGGFGVTFIDGGTFSFEATNNVERFADDTFIAGALVPAGHYEFNDVAVKYRSSGARAVSGNVRISAGDFYDGNRQSISGSALLRPDYHVSLEISAQHNDLTLAGQDFSANVFGGRIRYAQSTDLFVSAFVQYNNGSDELVTNVRVNLIHAPLSDVFLVYTERRLVETSAVLDRVLTAKATKLFAF